MAFNDIIGERMKANYEEVAESRLVRRMPVAIRLDGKAFHTFTRGFIRPFDTVFQNAMAKTMEYLCQNIQGAVLGYTQSDEITLILIDYQSLDTEAWFGYRVQKMCSISASMATMAFNRFFKFEVDDFCARHTITALGNYGLAKPPQTWDSEASRQQWLTYTSAFDRGAMFDARVFNVPKEEVCNLVYWRQLDAIRNSIQMAGQAYFSHKELMGMSCEDIKDMLHRQKNIKWEDYPICFQRGTAWTKEKGIDTKMPKLVGPDRDYVDKLIYIESEE